MVEVGRIVVFNHSHGSVRCGVSRGRKAALCYLYKGMDGDGGVRNV